MPYTRFPKQYKGDKMSSIEVVKDASGKPIKAIIKDVKVAHVYMKKPDTQLNGETKFSVTTVIEDKAIAAELKSICSKNPPKVVEGEEANTKLKVNTDKAIVHVVKFRANTKVMRDNAKFGLRKGDEIAYDSPHRPKVFINGEDVTMTTLVGHGSTADVEVRLATNPNFGDGTTAYLDKITVTNLVEVPQREGFVANEKPSLPRNSTYVADTSDEEFTPAPPVDVEFPDAVPVAEDLDGFDPF